MLKPTILITGASSGIGRASAELFSKKGWNVAATMRSPEKAEGLEALPGVTLYRLDVTDEDTITGCIRQVIQDTGRIDVLLNNAGYGSVGIFEAYIKEDIDRQFDTNVFGLMRVTKAILPHFRANKKGLIISVSSSGAQVTFPLYSLYHSTKWAIEGFIESLHYELEPLGIRVKLIEPGPIKTDFFSRSQVFIHKPELLEYGSYEQIASWYTKTAEAFAQGPEVVARKIYKAATDNSKKMRYPAGGYAAVMIFLKRFLPNRLFFLFVRNIIRKSK